MKVTVGIVDLRDEDGKQPTVHWVDLSAFKDYYIARVHFFPDRSLALQIENRSQTKLQLYRYDFLNKQPLKLLIEETNAAWINLHDLFRTFKNAPGQFLWASERTGFMHLALHDSQTGQCTKTLTSGSWVVQRLVDVDEVNSVIYFMANRETPLEIHLYSVNYSDEVPKIDRVTEETGCHSVHSFSRTYDYCITQWSSIDQQPVVRILDVKKKVIVRCLEHLQQGQLQTSEPFYFVRPQLLTIANRNNETLYAAIYKPEDEQGKQQKLYPTLVSVYGGPHVQRYVAQEKRDQRSY